MELFVFLIVLVIVIFFIGFLPLVSGVASYKYQARPQNFDLKKNDEEEEDVEPQGYLSPEERAAWEAKVKAKNSKFSKIKKIPNVTRRDIPFKFAPNVDHENGQIRQRKTNKTDADLDPSSYDFDIDEFIQEESEKDAKETASEFKERMYKGGNIEEMA